MNVTSLTSVVTDYNTLNAFLKSSRQDTTDSKERVVSWDNSQENLGGQKNAPHL